MSEPTITFIEKGHKYIHEESGDNLTSATTFIGQFFEKFDADKWSAYVAKRDGMTVQQVLDLWEEKRIFAGEFGTHVHNYAESIIKGTKQPVATIKKHEVYFKGVDEFMITEPHKFFDAEKVIGNPKWGIAGQVDGLSKTEKGIFLVDWKTNKKLDFNAYGDKRATGPINHLQDCNYSKYTLQLSLYRLILEQVYGWEIAGQILVHLTNYGTYHTYNIEYLKDEIVMMLQHDGRI
jgi:ATP-dependent exoDNAse (exonuclease V) beta subunit